VRCSAVYPWTPNVATRGVLTHLENTKSHFSPPHSPPLRRLRRLDFRRLRRLATRRLRRLGSAPLAPRSHVPLPMCPSTSIECPPNEFCWRRACGLRLKKVCYKVSVFENCQRQSCKAFIGLTNRAKMIGGGDPFYLNLGSK